MSVDYEDLVMPQTAELANRASIRPDPRGAAPDRESVSGPAEVRPIDAHMADVRPVASPARKQQRMLERAVLNSFSDHQKPALDKAAALRKLGIVVTISLGCWGAVFGLFG